jgi:DNA polymerase V
MKLIYTNIISKFVGSLLIMLRKIGTERNEVLEPLENAGRVSGFQSPADDYVKRRLDIEEKLKHDPINTFYFSAKQDYPTYYIKLGDILVVDRSKIPKHNNLLVVWYKEDWFLCQYVSKSKRKFVRSCIDGSEINTDEVGLNVFGVITAHYSEHL